MLNEQLTPSQQPTILADHFARLVASLPTSIIVVVTATASTGLHPMLSSKHLFGETLKMTLPNKEIRGEVSGGRLHGSFPDPADFGGGAKCLPGVTQQRPRHDQWSPGILARLRDHCKQHRGVLSGRPAGSRGGSNSAGDDPICKEQRIKGMKIERRGSLTLSCTSPMRTLSRRRQSSLRSACAESRCKSQR